MLINYLCHLKSLELFWAPVQVPLDKLLSPAPGLPADLSSGLAAQPRYDVSTSLSISSSSESFSYGFMGSDSGVSYMVCIPKDCTVPGPCSDVFALQV